MRPATTLAACAGALALALVAGLGVGRAVGPIDVGASAHDGHAAGSPAPRQVGGLAVSQDGYTLQAPRTTLPVGRSDFAFTIAGPDGRPLTRYTENHDKDLHLIVVRRDLTGFQHVHPTRAADGTWSVPLTMAKPGAYKVFTDFIPEGREQAIALAADLTVPGSYSPAPLGGEDREALVDDYRVSLAGELVAGTSSRLTLTVSKQGMQVTDLEPYLGAYGHLVALREGDLAYLHVHPEEDAGDAAGPDITFFADVPTASTYRLFLDFQHGGVVRTAPLTARAATHEAAGEHDKAPEQAPQHGDAEEGGHDGHR